MSNEDRARQPKGIPTGGEFSASARGEADITLSPAHLNDDDFADAVRRAEYGDQGAADSLPMGELAEKKRENLDPFEIAQQARKHRAQVNSQPLIERDRSMNERIATDRERKRLDNARTAPPTQPAPDLGDSLELALRGHKGTDPYTMSPLIGAVKEYRRTRNAEGLRYRMGLTIAASERTGKYTELAADLRTLLDAHENGTLDRTRFRADPNTGTRYEAYRALAEKRSRNITELRAAAASYASEEILREHPEAERVNLEWDDELNIYHIGGDVVDGFGNSVGTTPDTGPVTDAISELPQPPAGWSRYYKEWADDPATNYILRDENERAYLDLNKARVL